VLEPDAVPLADVVPMWEAFDRIERAAAAAKTLLARGVEESRQWQRWGCRSAAEWMAKQSGRSQGSARSQLDASKRLGQLPATEDALRDGELSQEQTELISGAASANPDAEQQLLRRAKTASHKELRDEAQRARAGADPNPEATHARIHAGRRLRTWTDGEGAWNLSARGTVRDGATVMHALEPIIERLLREARKDGRRDDRETYAFDALVQLAKRDEPQTTKTSKPTHLALLRLDLEALRRGAVDGDERCEITGLGPIPVSTARDLLGESILELVITKGVDVLHVTHLGRGPTAAQRVALLWCAPHCSVEGCPRTRVEIDHRQPWKDTHHTRLDGLDPVLQLPPPLETRRRLGPRRRRRQTTHGPTRRPPPPRARTETRHQLMGTILSPNRPTLPGSRLPGDGTYTARPCPHRPPTLTWPPSPSCWAVRRAPRSTSWCGGPTGGRS
jgi:hypothetical protein